MTLYFIIITLEQIYMYHAMSRLFVQETFHTVVYFPSLHFFLHCHLRKLKVQNICIELHGTSLYT